MRSTRWLTLNNSRRRRAVVDLPTATDPAIPMIKGVGFSARPRKVFYCPESEEVLSMYTLIGSVKGRSPCTLAIERVSQGGQPHHSLLIETEIPLPGQIRPVVSRQPQISTLRGTCRVAHRKSFRTIFCHMLLYNR